MTRGGGGGVAPAVSLDPPQRVLALHAGHRSQVTGCAATATSTVLQWEVTGQR